MTKPNHTSNVLITAALLGAVLLGVWLGRTSRDAVVRSPGGASSREALFYQDSMHPWVKSAKPGKCSVCGMDLTAIYEGQPGFKLSDDLVALSSNNITVLNVQTEPVQRQEVTRTLEVAGALEADENRKTVVAAPAAGRIDDLTIRFPGVEVTEGERLITFYSPELTLEKRRFLVRARMSVQRDPTGGLSTKSVSDTDPYYSDLVSPQAGTIVERKVYKGQYVSDGEKMFTIVDLSVMWFRFDVYEQQLPWLTLGQTIDVTVPAAPGKVLPAVITFIEPMLNEATRTVKVRAELQNPLMELNGRKQRLLGLGMYAQGEIRAALRSTLAVPRSAVLQPGRSAYAYVDKGNGVYEQRRVKLGQQGDGYWEVLQGLEAGDRVVTSGNVLLDSQSQFMHSRDKAELTMEDSPQSAAMVILSQPAMVPGPMVATEDHKMEPDPMPPMTPAGDQQMPAPAERMISPGRVGLVPTSSAAKPAYNPRHPAQPAVSAATPGYRNSRIGPHDAAFDAAFNRVAELRSTELAERTAAKVAQPLMLTSLQAQDLQAILAAADEAGAALAEDNLEKFKLHLGALTEALTPAANNFPAANSLSPSIQCLIQACQPAPAMDLITARAQFLTVGAAVAGMAGELRKQSNFAELKVYHCAMAPKPGLWVQAKGPLHNPFFGVKMQNCGEEVLQ